MTVHVSFILVCDWPHYKINAPHWLAAEYRETIDRLERELADATQAATKMEVRTQP
jgi:hypothetical protein